MKQFVLEHFQSVYPDSCRLDSSVGDLLIQCDTGPQIAVIVINRAVQFNEIKERYQHNTARRIHTLFLIDRRMMPPDHSEVEAPGWLLTLHNLTHRRIYSYWCDGRSVTIRPIHLGWNWGSSIRSVQYGTVVDTSQLTPNWTEATLGAVTAMYATVSFNEGSFWKKQDPVDKQHNYYSWRNWRYSDRSANNNNNQTADGPTSDDYGDFEWWEEFHFEEDFAEQPTGSRYEEDRRQRQQPPPLRQTSDRVHYATLGIAMNASLDEVKQAYRRKALEFHPDLHPEYREKYTAKMADINAAFDAIRKKLNR